MRAFEQQVLDAMPRLRRLARSLSRDGADADDLLQDCLERAFARRASWRGDNLQGWLAAILSNLNRNRFRAEGRRGAVVDDDPDTLVAETPLADPLEHDRLVAALDRLSAEHRTVLMLVVVEGYRYAEVAEMLAVPVGTVMSRLSRARATLTAELNKDNIVEFRRNG